MSFSLEVLIYFIAGHFVFQLLQLTCHEIAKHLHISQRTVKNHRFSLMQKLNVKNTAGMTKTAMEMGLIWIASDLSK